MGDNNEDKVRVSLNKLTIEVEPMPNGALSVRTEIVGTQDGSGEEETYSDVTISGDPWLPEALLTRIREADACSQTEH